MSIGRLPALSELTVAFNRVFRFNQHTRDEWVAAQAAKVSFGARVLDVGAGPCRYAHLFGHCQYVAVDFMMLPDALRHIDVVTDIARLPFSDAVFDIVLCTEVLEHVPEPILSVAEMARVLTQGGVLLVTAPLGSGLHLMPHHYYGGFTPQWYRTFLPQLGFQNIQIRANGGFFKNYGQESQRFSSMIDPRQLNGIAGARRGLIALLWLLSFPWFRVGAPLLCHLLDSLDHRQEFTVGYYVTARRA